MIPSRPLSLRFVPFLRQPQPVLTHRAFSTTPNTSSSTTRQLLTSFRRTLQESWSVLQVTLPQPSEWKASCLTLTQQQDNRVARSLLQLHKEVHLLQYHGPRKYFFEQNNYPYQLLPSSWTTYFSRNVLEDEQPSASQQKSTTNSAQSSSQTSSSSSTSTVAKVPFVITTAMKESLFALGYETTHTKRLTPLDAHLLLQHQVLPEDIHERLPILQANHQKEQEQQQQQSAKETASPLNHQIPQMSNPTSIRQEPPPSTTADESTSEVPNLQIAASASTHKSSSSMNNNDSSPLSESELSSPEEEIPVQTSIATTTGASVESTGKLEWYRVVEVVFPQDPESSQNGDEKVQEERIVVGLHRTLEQAQQDCALRQELAERTDATTHQERQSRRSYEIQVPTATTTNSSARESPKSAASFSAQKPATPATTITKRKFSSKKSKDAIDASDLSWIPPSRPLLGDQSTTPPPPPTEKDVVEDHDASQVQTEKKNKAAPIDWMQTRRSMLMGGTPDAILQNASQALLDEEEDDDGNIISIVEHQLLSRFEIASVLEFGGGERIMTVLDDPENPTFGGAQGYMVVTAPSNRHMVQMADQLVRQMRYRKLQEIGVVGAMRGPEGNKRDPQEHWMVVNCQNYVVHILLEESRNHLQLEKLWSGEDPIWTVDDSEESWDA